MVLGQYINMICQDNYEQSPYVEITEKEWHFLDRHQQYIGLDGFQSDIKQIVSPLTQSLSGNNSFSIHFNLKMDYYWGI